MLSNLSELVSEFPSDTGHCGVEVMADNLSSSHLANELEKIYTVCENDICKTYAISCFEYIYE